MCLFDGKIFLFLGKWKEKKSQKLSSPAPPFLIVIRLKLEAKKKKRKKKENCSIDSLRWIDVMKIYYPVAFWAAASGEFAHVYGPGGHVLFYSFYIN